MRPPLRHSGLLFFLSASLLGLVGFGAGAALTGCTGYRLGTPQTAPLPWATLHVAPVKMRALIPQADAILTAAVRDAFARDGRLALAPTPDTAGAILEIVIGNYHRETATADPSDTGLARKFTLVLQAELTLRDGGAATNRAGAKPYFAARQIEIRRDIFADGGQQQAEYQILPLLAQDLADKALHAVLDTW